MMLHLRKHPKQAVYPWSDKRTLNGINRLPFILSLSKGLISVSVRALKPPNSSY